MQYNRALDCLALAMDSMLKGKKATAGAFLLKAAAMPDATNAVRILELSNAQAFAGATARKTKLRANEEDQDIKELVGDLDELDEDLEDTEDDIEDVEDNEDEDDEDMDVEAHAKALAAVLSAMKKKSKVKRDVKKR